jgi:DNA polymerase-1
VAAKLMLIDGNSLLFRAFFALPLLRTRDGIYTNGVYGFLTMFNRVVKEEQPTHIAVAFDMDRKTFRKDLYIDYKANRQAPPEELAGQFQLLRDLLQKLNVQYIEVPGFEADDIIGTLSRKAVEQGAECVIVTGDGDSLQLVSDKTKVIMTKKGISQVELYDPEEVQKKWGVEPKSLIEVKALMGDASDNIPGVPGIGPKTAVKLIQEFKSLENLYSNLDMVKGSLRQKLIDNKDKAFISRILATVVTDMDLECRLNDYAVREPDYDSLVELYRRLEFNQFINNLPPKPRAGQLPSEGPVAVNVISKPEDIQGLVQQFKDTSDMSLLIRTDTHHSMWGNLKDLFIEVSGKVFQIVPGNNPTEILHQLKPCLEDKKIQKYLHNAKHIQVVLLRHGIKLKGVAGDSMLLAYVLDPAVNVEDLCGLIHKYLNKNVDKDDYPLQATYIKDLYQAMLDTAPEELQALYKNIEMPLSNVLAYMEFTGVKVDRDILRAISEELAVGLAIDEKNIYELAGAKFNINSPKQLGKVLFEDLGLRIIKKTKSGYATGAEVLEQLYGEHEIIAYILDYRQLSKLKSTYVDALPPLIHPETGRVHTIFKQAQTTTGRLSSAEPNLQNIPIKMEEGRRIRKAFLPGRDDYVLMSADYSQIDLRSLAHISGDEILINTFKQGIDIHARTASEIFHVPIDQVNSDLRRRAKAVNFGIIYGISDFGLARDTGVSRSEARRYIENYLNSYPGVKKYMNDIVEFGQEYGYVETLLKRRRYLPDLKAKNKMVQAFARRAALNTPIQGTSADIIKIAMIKVFEEIRQRRLKSRLLLQVHDELLLEVPVDELKEISCLLHNCMETAVTLKVPLEVSIKCGTNWYDMQPLNC